MDFQEIKEQLSEIDPTLFLDLVLEHEQAEDSPILFSRTIEEQFEQNCQFLSSSETISLEDISTWKEDNFLVVAQTIDGDYIAGTTEHTMVIPVSLYKADIEIYELFLADFFIAYTNNTIESAILPKINDK